SGPRQRRAQAHAGRRERSSANERRGKSVNVPISRAPLSGADYSAVEFDPATGEVVMLDQRRLPTEIVYHRYRKPDEVAQAIRDMVVRGAPAIGIAAAYGLVLQAVQERG